MEGDLYYPRCAGFTKKLEDRDKPEQPLSACRLTGPRRMGAGLGQLEASSCFSWGPLHNLPCRSKAAREEEPEPGGGGQREGVTGGTACSPILLCAWGGWQSMCVWVVHTRVHCVHVETRSRPQLSPSVPLLPMC